MKGKEHMTIGTSCALGVVAGLLTLGGQKFTIGMPLLVAGAFVGSYMPDIDSHKSTASQFFNKALTFFIISMGIAYILWLQFNLHIPVEIADLLTLDMKGLSLFCIVTILGKLSPHRMFTHKWFGTCLFCYSVYLMGHPYLTMGFTLGYLLHIVADKISIIKFFQFQLPMTNSRKKLAISW